MRYSIEGRPDGSLFVSLPEGKVLRWGDRPEPTVAHHVLVYVIGDLPAVYVSPCDSDGTIERPEHPLGFLNQFGHDEFTEAVHQALGMDCWACEVELWTARSWGLIHEA